MTHTDQKLFELFSDKTLSFGCVVNHISFGIGKLIRKCDIDSYWKGGQEFLGDDGIMRQLQGGFEVFGHEPRLEDVFRVGVERCFDIKVIYNHISIDDGIHTGFFDYNPTLSLLKQEEKTKLAIINLFTND